MAKLLPMLVCASSRSIWAMYDLRSSSVPFTDASSPGSCVSKSKSSSLSKDSKSSSSWSSESDSGGLGPTSQHRKCHLVKNFEWLHLPRDLEYYLQKRTNIHRQTPSQKSLPENGTTGRYLQKSTQAEMKDSTLFFF